jgi:hypothetical protein
LRRHHLTPPVFSTSGLKKRSHFTADAFSSICLEPRHAKDLVQKKMTWNMFW